MLKKLVKKPLFPICPTSGKLLGWRLFQAFSVHVTLLLVGYQAAFDASINTWHYLFIYLGDFTYLINTVLYFLTAIKNKGKVNRERDLIVKKNLNFYFVVDVISLLPLEIFGLASSSVLFTAALLRLNRVLRIIRITHFFSKMQEDIRINLMISNVVAILSLTVFVLNVSTCIWYVLSCDNIEKGGVCRAETWATTFLLHGEEARAHGQGAHGDKDEHGDEDEHDDDEDEHGNEEDDDHGDEDEHYDEDEHGNEEDDDHGDEDEHYDEDEPYPYDEDEEEYYDEDEPYPYDEDVDEDHDEQGEDHDEEIDYDNYDEQGEDHDGEGEDHDGEGEDDHEYEELIDKDHHEEIDFDNYDEQGHDRAERPGGAIGVAGQPNSIRYIVSLYFTMQTIFTIGYGDFYPVNITERLFAVAIMLCTYIAYGLILGRSAAILARFSFRRQTFKQRFATIKKYLKRACIKEDLERKVIKYYEYRWEHCFGNTVDDMINSLPIVTRHSIVKNLYDQMFSKVAFLKDAPESFLKEISLITQKVVLVSGQIFLCKGQEQNCMCFINHGVLEVQGSKSTYKLSDGQYFGEISLVHPVYSNATIKSSTDCELFVIKRDTLSGVLYFYPEIAESLNNLIKVSVKRLSGQDIFIKSGEMTQNSKTSALDSTNNLQSICHSSAEIKSLRELIKFLTDWIIYPNSMFWKVWEKVILVAIFFVVNWYMIEAAYSSYYIKDAYGYSTQGNLKFFCTYCFEALFVFDIFVSMKKTHFLHIHRGVDIIQKDIRRKYIRSITFYLDVIAVLPLEIFSPAFSNPWEFVLVLKLNRLLKLWKFGVIIWNMSKYLYNSEEKILATKLISMIIITINCFGCVLFSVACSFRSGRCAAGSWPYAHPTILVPDAFVEGYTTSFYWVATTLSQTGYGDLHPFIVLEYIFTMLAMTGGFIVFNFCVIDITAILLNSSNSRKIFREIISALHKYIRFHVEEKGVIKDINHHLNVLWNEYRGEGYSTSELLRELPENLRDEVLLDELGGILQNVPFFEGANMGFLKKVVKIVSSNLHCPGDFVYHAGDLGEEMYFMRRGFVEILSEDLCSVVNKLGSGGYFGEFGMLNRAPYNASVRCATYCEILSMSRKDLDGLLESYPSLQRELKQWELACETMKNLKANTVGKPLPKTFGTFRVHSALAAAMVVPVSIIIRKPLICNVAGWWSSDLRKKIVCPILCSISPAGTCVRYKKESDDPSQTAETYRQRAKSLGDPNVYNEVPFKISQSGQIMSQASGLFQKRKIYTNNNTSVIHQDYSDVMNIPKRDLIGQCTQEKLDWFFSFFLIPRFPLAKDYLYCGLFTFLGLMYVIVPKSTFNVSWEITVTALCYVSIYTLTLQAAFYDDSITLWVVNYLIDAIMIANIFLGFHTAYYNEEGVLITNPLMCAKHYLRTNFIFEFLANILPTDIFAFASKGHKLGLLSLLRLNRLLRISRVIIFFWSLETWIIIPVVLARAISFFVSLLLVTHCMACFWVTITCPPLRDTCVPGGWGTFAGDDRSESSFTPIVNNSVSEKYAISFYWAVITTTQVGYGDIVAHNNLERLFTSIVMILGALGYSYSISTVASSFGHTAYGKQAFRDRLHNMEFYLTEKKAGRKAIDRVMNYYSFLWKRTSGLNLTQLMRGLPLSLRTELSFHVYKKIIRKVILFQDAELSFIKLVSRYCKPVFIPKDEFIIKSGDICPLMHFITKGTVDVISEDGNTIYDTLKDGDYFGEMSCLCGTPSLTTLKASRNCDLFTLDKDDLDTCLRFHKDLSTKIFEVANIRYKNFQKNIRASSIIITKKRHTFAAITAIFYNKTSVGVEDVEIGTADIDTVKSNSDLSSCKKTSVSIEDVELGITDIDTTKSNSDVLSTDAHDQIPWFKYPLCFTISHHSYFVKVLTFISHLFNIILCIIIPYETFYNERHISIRVTIILSEVFYLIEMFFKFHLTYEDEHGIEMKEVSRTAQHYLKSKSGFVVDLIALIPFEVLSFAVADDFYRERVYLILQLIHLVRMFRIILMLRPDYWNIPRWFYSIGIYVLCFSLLIFIVHWITSIAFFIDYGQYNNWEYAIGNLTAVPHKLYAEKLYLIVATMTTTGYGDISINFIADALYVSVIIIIAKLLYSFIVGYYSSSMSSADIRQVDAQQDFDGIQLYMDENGLHGAMQLKVLHYIEYIWERNHGYHLSTLFIDLPFVLKRDIRLISTISAMEKVHFLGNLDENFLSHLSLQLKSQYFTPGQFIVHKHDLRQCMYFISQGIVDLYDDEDDSDAKRILHPSDTLCEETLFDDRPIQYSAKCADYVDVFVLEKDDLETMLAFYPEAIQAISAVVGRRWAVNLLYRSKGHRMSIYQRTMFDDLI